MPNTPLRNFYPVVVLLMLAACGGSSSSGQTYTIAGDISGLTSGDVVLANGTSTLTVTAGESSWQFPSAFAQGSLYLVAVQTQPAGEMCLVTGGASGKLTADVTGVTVACSEGLWTWEGGSSASSGGGVYGTQGTGSTSNLPGARESASSWTDSAGNLWLFGGYGYASSILGDLNDLWQYSPSTGEWTWISGTSALNATGVYGMQNAASPSNLPGARQQASAWIDSSGNLWLFGGYGYDSTHNADLNDLWQYSSTTGEWTWVSGSDVGNANGSYGAQGSPSTSNVPGAREGATSWIDSSGSLWLFGGYGHDSAGAVGNLNDLWRYNPNTGAWTWISGANTVNAAGAYGTAGVESGSNAPGGRQAASSWIDSSGNLWLFGGYGDDSAGNEGDLNDLWQYSPSTGEWTWISGADTVKAAGTYGTETEAAAGNVPGARQAASAWIDSSGNLWLFGGYGYDSTGAVGDLGDLWRFSPSAGQWTWINGAETSNSSASFGTEGSASAYSQPGSRHGASAWMSSGNLWMFGGTGYGATGGSGYLNDLWQYSSSQ